LDNTRRYVLGHPGRFASKMSRRIGPVLWDRQELHL